MPVLGRLLGPIALVTVLAVGGSAGTYVVRPGDTLSGIAAKFGVSVKELAQANGITDPNKVYAGRTLEVPGAVAVAAAAAPAPSAGTRAHVVAPGETLTRIAGRYGTTVSALVSANGIVDPNHVRIGTTLKVPGVAAPATGLPRRLAASPARLALIPHFKRWADANGVPADLVMAVTWLESGWQNSVVSHAGAIGIGQLLPSTADFVSRYLIGVSLDPTVPEENIRMTVRYLRWLIERAGGNVDIAVAGYYQGPASVAAHGMFQVTSDYLAIMKALRPRFARV